jgi:hypothetical protein
MAGLLTLIGIGTAVMGTAVAAYPNDVTFSSLDPSLDAGLAYGAYTDVVLELGAAVAYKPFAPATTLGVNGFEISVGHSVTFVDSQGDGPNPSSWERLHADGEPDRAVWIPRLEARKGLPASFEISMELGIVALSRQSVVGGHIRWAPIEGYRRLPDVILQGGYTGYTGNDELELGVMDIGGAVGYTLPFGSVVGINTARFSPYVGLTRLTIHASPSLTAEQLSTYNLTPVSGFRSSAYYLPELNLWQLQGGFHLVSGGMSVQLSASYAVGIAASVNAGLGLVF